MHFGKKLSGKTGEVLQGMYSEKAGQWIQDERIWQAMQTFLFEHQGHALCFDDDETHRAIEDYVEIEWDDLVRVG
ncbi:hypothetical protein [Candidatus Entotheonella palauensis]|nr:hypothetical protein [Candidatus Entotheonella palauensis]